MVVFEDRVHINLICHLFSSVLMEIPRHFCLQVLTDNIYLYKHSATLSVITMDFIKKKMIIKVFKDSKNSINFFLKVLDL